MPTARFKTLSRMIRRLRPPLKLTLIRMVIAPMTMIPHLMMIGVTIVVDAIIVGVGIRPILALQPQIKMSWLSPIQGLVDADVIIHTIWMIVGVIMVIVRNIILASAILQDIGRMVVSIAVTLMIIRSILMRYVRDVQEVVVIYVFRIALLRLFLPENIAGVRRRLPLVPLMMLILELRMVIRFS